MRTYPITLEVILHIYYSPEPLPQHLLSPAGDEALSRLESAGLIRVEVGPGSGYRTTERGNAWVEMICHTPYPRAARNLGRPSDEPVRRKIMKSFRAFLASVIVIACAGIVYKTLDFLQFMWLHMPESHIYFAYGSWFFVGGLVFLYFRVIVFSD